MNTTSAPTAATAATADTTSPLTKPEGVAFFESGRTQYATVNLPSPCCYEGLHRPAGSGPGDTWFCTCCGHPYADEKPLRSA